VAVTSKDPESRPVPHQNLQAVAATIPKQKQMAGGSPNGYCCYWFKRGGNSFSAKSGQRAINTRLPNRWA